MDMIQKLQIAFLDPSALEASPYGGERLSMPDAAEYLSSRLNSLVVG